MSALSIHYSALRDENFCPDIHLHNSEYTGPYYQLYLDEHMDVLICLSEADCRKLMDALGSRPPLPKTDEQIDAEAEPLDPMEHQRNAAVAEPLRSIVNAISGGEDAPF